MPFIQGDLLQYSTCKGEQLNCAYKIFNKMSSYNKVSSPTPIRDWGKLGVSFFFSTKLRCFQIIDPVRNKSMKCLEPCRDFSYHIQTTVSSYPARPTFIFRKCHLVNLQSLEAFQSCHH